MRTCQLEKITIHYEIVGDGIPILALHGWMPDHELMTSCLEPFFQRNSGYKRIYPDLPGCGLTKGEPWINRSDDFLEIMLQFIDKVIGKTSFILIGESYGGYLARGILLKKFSQILGLGTICSVGEIIQSKRNTPEFNAVLRDEVYYHSLDPSQQKELDGFLIVQIKEIVDRFAKEIAPGLKRADEEFLANIQDTGNYNFTFDVDEKLPIYSGPSLFLLGRQDNIVGFQDHFKLLSKFPRASYVVLDAAGHNLQQEQEKLLHAHLREWLDRIDYAITGEVTSQSIV
ncbi:2-succinyl-6-hydroxy-2,4-cyclohexadiene-1-carboxylate synthase [Candidatus Lokiarchaeum ossiferum]|uniref:2-succinyl-6-hydroxy-2, 4-cyclohexadiene-1-carboxylate synthase n=1 Tax=Candidatus Lokiarchaeum ossiferum TaxID=2951803 RepID=A0ABY6HM63_9ARCH|nr:2-succinyl-6-hydroxy-2,4-cyclohexadiene-1-carboxylate synthase [Candidatus Lokiarchaeum sp. B-35]